VHEGIHAALDAAVSHGCAMGLGTGNVEVGARVKLARAGLADRFTFGGFGSDHEDRAELIRIGAERGAQHLGRALGACRVVVIGDTPKDVRAAQAIGAESFAVATGPFSTEQLARTAPTHVFEHLGAPGAIEALLSA
jgi:phosphoglycolate phosphatase-like HAD superfamily hydrolase